MPQKRMASAIHYLRRWPVLCAHRPVHWATIAIRMVATRLRLALDVRSARLGAAHDPSKRKFPRPTCEVAFVRILVAKIALLAALWHALEPLFLAPCAPMARAAACRRS